MSARPTLYVVHDAVAVNERTRAMRGLAQALSGHSTDARPVVEIHPLADGGWQCADGAAPVSISVGDTLLIAACGWMVPGFCDAIAALKARGVMIAAFVHDIARLRRPEWYEPAETANFRRWLETLAGLAARVMVPSTVTVKDLATYRRAAKLPEVETVRIRLGDGMLNPDLPTIPCPISGRFVLVAGPIEIRMNHVVLVEAWRRLGARLRPEELPRLIFAGAIGTLTEDMRERLARGSNPLIETLLDPDDASLAALYRACEFSMFPALYEGWGLAVTESLSFGKPVFAANAMALPEAGGRLARYFDPLDPEDTSRHVERVLRDPGDLARWNAEIARNFHKAPWSEAARAVLAALA